MKKFFLWAISALFIVLPCSAQNNQKGCAKTKGRLEANGKIIKGIPLENVLVKVKDRTALLTDHQGNFSFPVPTSSFYLEQVSKKGYVLMDPDVVAKQYDYSGNSLVLVLETEEQQLDERLVTERLLRRTLTNQLRQREDEIDSLKRLCKITDEEYRQKIQKLYEETNQNSRLIKEMVERYSKIDYDQLSNFDLQISKFILNGELARADSLLNTKGNLSTRAKEYHDHEAANAKERAELSQRQAQLEQSEALAIQKRDDIANDCYRKYEICKMGHQNDSAAFFISLRAGLDPMNVQWQMDAGKFILHYLTDYNTAMEYLQKALDASISINGRDNSQTALLHADIGEVYQERGEYDRAMEAYETAYAILKSLWPDENHYEFCVVLDYMATLYVDLGEMQQSMNFFKKEIGILQKLEEANEKAVAESYLNIAYMEMEMGNYDTAMVYAQKAMDMVQGVYLEHDPRKITYYTNMGMIYKHYADVDGDLEYYVKADSCYKKALDESLMVYGECHPQTANIYGDLDALYGALGQDETALEYGLKDLEVSRAVRGERHPDVAQTYSNLGLTYKYLGDTLRAKEYYHKALGIFRLFLDEYSVNMASCYVNLGGLYDFCQVDDSAMYYYEKSIKVFERAYGQHRYMSILYNKMSRVQVRQGDLDCAADLLHKAIDMERKTSGEGHNNMANHCYSLASVYYKQGDYSNALAYYDKALNIWVDLFGEGCEDVSDVYLSKGNAYRAMGDYDNALAAYEKSYAIRESLFGANDSRTEKAASKIAELKEAGK